MLTASAITWQEPVPKATSYNHNDGSFSSIYLYHVGKGQFLAMGTTELDMDNRKHKRSAYLDSTDVAAICLTVYDLDDCFDNDFCAVRAKSNYRWPWSTDNNDYYYGYFWLAYDYNGNVYFLHHDYLHEPLDNGIIAGYDGLVWSGPEENYFGRPYSYNLGMLGWDPFAEDTDWEGNPLGTNQMLHLGYTSTWRWVSEDNYQLYLSQKRLYRAAVAAEVAGVDYTVYTDIYEVGRKDQLDAASEELEAASNTQAILENSINTATLDNPQDVTALMVNPDFTTGNTNGWVLNMPNAADLGYQDNTDYTHGEANLTGFIQAWHPNNALENGSITTTINLLPAGRYRLEADVVATCQTKPATDDTSGCQLFVSGFALDQGTDVATANNSPQRFAVDFTLRGGALTLGLRARNTDSNWLAGDNFRLTYYGKSEFPEGDLNEDGKVNVADITKVVNIALKKNNQE